MGTCATCKHWEENQPQSEEDEELGYPVHVINTIGFGKCLLAHSQNGNIDEHRQAVAIDWESYQAVLLTRPAFECNQHEPKTE